MLDYVEIDNRIKIQNAIELLKCDITIKVNRFDEIAVSQFAAEFRAAHESGQDIIPIIIDTLGGDIHGLFAMHDLIKSTNKTVATIVLGKAFSSGAALLSLGDEGYRFASPKSCIMIHDTTLTSTDSLSTEDVKSYSKYLNRTNNDVFNMMESNCGLEKGTILNMLRQRNSVDWFLTPYQAKQINLINRVKVPKLITKVIVTSELR